ncbi:MAG: hypothetical protein K8S99_08185 [Planctomycetes bacterium]|nr:hypothetical protein [Planctomycetota bacterium]
MALAMGAAGCSSRPSSVGELARRTAGEEAVLVASVEPVIRQMLREWEPWGKTFSGKPVVTDYQKIPTRYAFVKEGQPVFRPATKEEIERHQKSLSGLFACVEIADVWMRPTRDIKVLRGDNYDIQAIERIYSYEIDRVDRVQRTADPRFPFEAVIRVKVTTTARVTRTEHLSITPESPAGFRRLTDDETKLWRACNDNTISGVFYCNQIHTRRHRMPPDIRDLDLPLPGQYHTYPEYSERYYSHLHKPDTKHPAIVQEVIDRHVAEWEKMTPSVTTGIETVSLWYSLEEARWVTRWREHPKFKDDIFSVK